ncbi:AzlD domain-containing protein [Aquihabitans sp. G128]|uniref:AzlD domain-containing protein n=1 Tax=Aquihabitans sp. G128 TaxID=2849779 RepID=UPI001C22AF65|nr:AzlD domain-containing protein [Aquihabitans sp. G128]QXC59712.1 AzlD domain-containing protein [Aquihabitans sp. G128]
MSWLAIFVLAAGAYALKALGVLVLGGRELPAPVARCVALLPAALLPALVAVQTLTTDDRWVLDARAAGVGAAIVAAWRRAPFPVVILLGAAVTAGVRALG